MRRRLRPDATDPNAEKIPSKYKPNKDGLPQGAPTFRSDVLTVTLDVAVLDNKGNPIPKIPQDEISDSGRQHAAEDDGVTRSARLR